MRSTRGITLEMTTDTLLEVRDLVVEFDTDAGRLRAVGGVSLDVRPGECLAVVGESGSGKTQLFLACLGLLPGNAHASGSARFAGTELIGAPEEELNGVRGLGIGMVMQDPMNALTPHLSVERQLTEGLVDRRLASRAEAHRRALEALATVGITEPGERLGQYPHELSGGMRQRVAIAMALIGGPRLLIADEPTTALDVTVQARILELLRSIKARGLAIVLVTHDLGVVAGLADRVAVMYAGRLVEVGPAPALLGTPAHPYTAALLACVPRLDAPGTASLAVIDGQPPAPGEVRCGCAFAARCPLASEVCREIEPVMRGVGPERMAACHAPYAVGPAP